MTANISICLVYDDGSKVVFPLNSNTGYSNPTNIKYTEANGATPSERSGQGEVDWNLKGQGDAWAFAVDGQGNEGKMVPCLVPPPPK